MRKFLEANITHNTKKMSKYEWLKERGKGIGGSDASSVVGLNPYKSSVSVYLEKLSYIKNNINNTDDKTINSILNKNTQHIEDTIYTNYKIELGNKLKDFVAKEFALKTNKKVRNINGILKNDKYPFAIANIDRAIVGEKAFLECKVSGSYFKGEWKNGVPINYKVQCYHYMAVTGATHCYVAALIGNEDLVIHKIDRDEEIIEDIMKLEKMFWEKCVLGDNIPIPDGSDDYSKVLKNLYKESKEEEIILFEKENYLNRYDDVVGLIKELDSEKKAIEQYIQSQMKEYEIAYIGDRKISWKKQSKNILDSKRLKKEHPDLAKKYMKTTTSRVFRI
ncbi:MULTISPECIES: YqaJ viral recombinase family nuclease [unclassified Romboutsia]|uniref:YqaJ viral recombinase family nuclease n=1 Tax=unclassified Romboutsia TaxID=2626894 RepID=UPI001896DCEE|nr:MULTISPECIES: YqaJ viral recombinase family protein [unclassified Romboutsia]MDB8804407.1 YqaJ viral recombinase family protein [Romboutsia sp. 1001216sp1]MDB8806669.1 YqaJ viral recombinase family protein [Romboutsia sp. 1001216sp1]MDB8810055.1 YqaJ viral recombinase family protein [Romboutsia sp. 1001216sp1]MDB8815802.1 YqaJ viral recombinase family protein [Romboutsia sp. 1001216sp1]MDB8818252.1 YqaJ viral recombinase family protein [Romboutsia sp. 1001216sp1]